VDMRDGTRGILVNQGSKGCYGGILLVNKLLEAGGGLRGEAVLRKRGSRNAGRTVERSSGSICGPFMRGDR